MLQPFRIFAFHHGDEPQQFPMFCFRQFLILRFDKQIAISFLDLFRQPHVYLTNQFSLPFGKMWGFPLSNQGIDLLGKRFQGLRIQPGDAVQDSI